MADVELIEMSAANGAFWASIGSWAVPQAVLGATLLWLDHRSITPPSFVAWTTAGYAVALGLYQPSATVYGAIAALLLRSVSVSDRRTPRESSTADAAREVRGSREARGRRSCHGVVATA